MKKILLVLAMVLLIPCFVFGATLFWSQELPSPNDLAGWRIYQSNYPGAGYAKIMEILFTTPMTEYQAQITIPSPGPTGVNTYYFVLTSFDTSQNESGYSNEVSISVTDIIAPRIPVLIRIIP